MGNACNSSCFEKLLPGLKDKKADHNVAADRPAPPDNTQRGRNEEDEIPGSEVTEETTQLTAEHISAAAFNRAVSRILPDAIPTDLKLAAELDVGRVLLYQGKSSQPLDFARGQDGSPLDLFDLLSDEQASELVQESEVVALNETSEQYLYQPSADQETKVKLSLDFGRVFVVSSNLYTLVNSLSLSVKAGHPVIRRAQERGGVIMVISKVYQGERASIELGHWERGSMTPVFYSPTPTNLAYELLRLKVNENGILEPVFRDGPPKTRTDAEREEEEVAEAQEVLPTVRIRVTPVPEEAPPPPQTRPVPGTAEEEDDEKEPATGYAAVIEERAELVSALVQNRELQASFLALVTARGAWDNVKELSDYLHSVQTVARETGGGVVPTEFQDLVGKMSNDQETKEEEIKSLIVATEAFKEFNAGAMKCIARLSSERREDVLDLISQIPFGSTSHIFARDAMSSSDPVYYRFLRKIGFGENNGSLDFVVDSGASVDMLGAGITAVVASKQT